MTERKGQYRIDGGPWQEIHGEADSSYLYVPLPPAEDRMVIRTCFLKTIAYEIVREFLAGESVGYLASVHDCAAADIEHVIRWGTSGDSVAAVLAVYVSTDHAGYWPVGVASIVLAHDETEARALLDVALAAKGLSGEAYTLERLDSTTPQARILWDGNY